MKQLRALFVLFAISTVFALTAPAQRPSSKATPEPVKERQAVQAPKREPVRSLKALKRGEIFVSKTGGFSIALPRKPFETENKFDKEAGETGGETVTWSFEEGVIIVAYVDDPVMDVVTEENYDEIAQGAREGVESEEGKIVSERSVTFGKYSGCEIVFDNENGRNTVRIFPTKGRLYTAMIVAYSDVQGSEAVMLKALNSLTLAEAITKN